MDIARLQAELRREALHDIKGRSAKLRSEFHARGARKSTEATREIAFLERATEALGDRARSSGLLKGVESLRETFSTLPLAKDGSVGAVLRDINNGDGPPAVASRPRAATCANATQQVELPTCSPGTVEMTAVSAKGAEGLPQLAAFLFPDLPSDEAKDEVRILALGGCLIQELLKHSYVTSNAGTTFFFTSTAVPVSATSDSTISEADPPARSCIGISFSETGVQVVTTTADEGRNHSLDWLTLGAGVAVGIAALVHAPGAAVGLAAAAVGAGARGSSIALERWQDHVLQKMRAQIPKTLEPLPHDEILPLQTAGLCAEQALLQALAEGPTWQPWRLSRLARSLKLPLHWRPSALRKWGCAFATHFHVQLPARSVYAVLQHLSITGSLDPDCKAMWARPIGEQGTSLRYMVFASKMAIRDFFLISRLAKTDGRGSVAGLPGYAEDADGSFSGSAPAASSPWEQQLPPASRNRTNEFEKLRRKRTDGTPEAQWRERLRATLERSNPTDVRRFRDAESTPHHSVLQKLACESCNRFLDSCGATVCDVCHRTLCEACGNHEEDVGPLLGRGNGGGARRFSRVLLSVCTDCQHFIDKLRWQWAPSSSVSPASMGIQRLYEELATSMTQMVAALAQLDGLHRLCSGPASQSLALSECWAQLGPSREAAIAAKKALEQVLDDLTDFEAPTDRMQQLRDRLRQHGQNLLQRCKPSLNLLIEGSRECEQHCPPPAASWTATWTVSDRPAERYAFCEGSCPPDLLKHVGLVPDEDIAHGHIQMMGVVAADMPDGGSRVDVVADVDPRVYLNFAADRDVRHHVLNTADRLRQLVEVEERQQREEALQELASLAGRLSVS